MVILHSNCNYVGCKEEEELVLDEDYTEEELNKLASDNAIERVALEGWFTVKGDEDEDQ